jgi:hypothetical protein
MILCNRAGTVTLTLPNAQSAPGRKIYVTTLTDNAVLSASSNIIPSLGGAAGTAILPAQAGASVMLVSNGTAWVETQEVSRAVLGLGNAATATLTASATDTTAGRVLTVGAGHQQLDPTLYRQSNIVGPVSQTGGAPTGAVIERGSNANGEFVRFADGTQICTIPNFSMVFSTSNLLVGVWTFPAVFTAAPVVTMTLTETGITAPFAITQDIHPQLTGASTTQVSLRVRGQSTGWTAVATAGANAVAIGRWF